VEKRLHEELDAALGGRLPTAGDLAKLPYADKVIHEALRLYPPAWRIGRTSGEPLEVGGYVLPAGANILMSQWVTHRDERWFPNPERCNPDRWGAESIAKVVIRQIVVPYIRRISSCFAQALRFVVVG
jgi:cytochrome P450